MQRWLGLIFAHTPMRNADHVIYSLNNLGWDSEVVQWKSDDVYKMALITVPDSQVALDGEAGFLFPDPPTALRAELDARRERESLARERATAAAASPGATRDGVAVSGDERVGERNGGIRLDRRERADHGASGGVFGDRLREHDVRVLIVLDDERNAALIEPSLEGDRVEFG